MNNRLEEAVDYGKSSNRLEANEPSVQETEMILKGIEQEETPQFVSSVVKLVKVPETEKEKERLHG